ncbi:MAG: hypothetical protein AAGH48_07285, partial [Pseudomonadota bacterium]
AARTEAALSIDPDNPDLLDDLGLFKLTQALRSQNAQARTALLDASLASLERSLSAAPMRPSVWMRYAYALERRRGYTDAVDRALLMSYDVGPAEQDALLFRLGFALSHWEQTSPALKRASARQAAVMWRYCCETRTQLLDLYLQLDTEEKIRAINVAVADEARRQGEDENAFLEQLRNRRAALKAQGGLDQGGLRLD